MAQTILTERQQQLLSLLSQQKTIHEYFYLSGGTALSEYYLHHRYSEDLDFFSFEEIDPMSIQVVLKKIKSKVHIGKIDYQQSFNRNLFFLHFGDEIIKTEFTYYPFTQLEKVKQIEQLKVDSLLDIAVNKVFTIYQNPRSRDFIDLYMIMQKEQWSMTDLRKKARMKFDTIIDPLQMAKQLLQINTVKDYPRMLIDLEEKSWKEFFTEEAEKLKPEIIE